MDGSHFGQPPSWRQNPSRSTRFDSATLVARIADDHKTMHDAWALRYESYSSYGYIAENAERLFADEYDAEPTSKTIVIYQDQTAIGSVRVCLHDPEQAQRGHFTMPSMNAFPDIIPGIAEKHSSANECIRMVEIMRLVAHPRFEKNIEVIFGLFRMAKYLTRHFQSKILFCGVRENHTNIYKRIGFNKACEARPYPKLNFKTALMYGIEEEYEVVQQKIPFLRNVSRFDQTYEGLMAGKFIPVFGDTDNGLNIGPPAKYSEVEIRQAA